MCSNNSGGDDEEKKNYKANKNRQGLISIGRCDKHWRSIKMCKNSNHGKFFTTKLSNDKPLQKENLYFNNS